MEILKDEAESFSTQESEFILIEFGDILPIDHNLTGGGVVQSCDQAEQGSFSASRLTSDG